ncbi:MAG: hypothetical protein M1831_000560, partial [Alyxoria varia]
EQSRSYHNNVRNANMPGSQQASGSSGARKLPSPPELASRIEEARTSSKLLIQLTQTTPASEFESHELIKEFADRCNMAYRSLQGFANATEPEPDEETLKTLIETCEQLSLASSKYQRAKLAATRHRKSNTSNVNNGYNNAAGMNVNAQEMPAAEPQNAGADSSGYQYPPEKQGAPQSDGYSSGPSAPPTFSPFTASQYSTGNPFSDENRISMNAPRPQQQSQQQHQQQQYQANSNSFFAAATANNTSNQPSQQHSTFPNRAPQAGSYELPASTASQGYSSHTRGLSSLSNAQGQYGDISDVPPPSGPPPGRTHGSTNHTKAGHVQTASEGSHNELYETSPVATTHPNKPTAVPGSYNELYDTSPVATTHPNKPTAVPGSYNELYDTSPVAATHPNKPTAVPGSYNELYDTSPVATTHPNKPTAVPGSYNELYDTSPVATTHPNKPTAVPGSYNELYDTSPVAPAHNTAHTNQPTGPSSAQHNSSSSAYDDLYSLDQEEPRKPSSPTIPDQDVDGKNAPQSGVGGGGAAAAGAGGGGAGGGAQGRVRDDEPMTPVAGVSGSGWRY